MILWPHPLQRHCCAACREPIPDIDTISEVEAERRREIYEAARRRYRVINPHRVKP